jgi:hypothetical protein
MFHVLPADADAAWADGACALALACNRSDGETDGPALLADIKAGRTTLIGQPGQWLTVQVQDYGKRKVLHISAIHAPGMADDELVDRLKDIARHNGCDCIQGACGPAVARLWRQKFGFEQAHIIMRLPV